MSRNRFHADAAAKTEASAMRPNPTVYREACGTFDGLRLHQANGEPLCSECVRGEAIRLLELEGIPQPVRPYWRQARNTRA